MKTIEAAAVEHYNKPIAVGTDDFKAGVEFAQRWIPVEEELPPKGIEVFVKVRNLIWVCTKHSVAYLKEKTTKDVWIIEGMHCTHCENSDSNCITHWRYIELK